MPFLVIAGITVPIVTGAKQPPEFGGSLQRAYAGNLRSTRRWEKRVWKFQTMKQVESANEQLEQAIALGAIVSVSGIGLDFLAPPAFNTLNTSTTGGTLAAGTYYYTIASLNGSCESAESSEGRIVTTGSTSSNTLGWSAATGATGYKVYRGSAVGGENVYYLAGNVLTFTDTGAAAVAGNPVSVPTYQCVVTVEDNTGADYVSGTSSDGNNFYRSLSLTVREV